MASCLTLSTQNMISNGGLHGDVHRGYAENQSNHSILGSGSLALIYKQQTNQNQKHNSRNTKQNIKEISSKKPTYILFITNNKYPHLPYKIYLIFVINIHTMQEVKH
eukprot:420264_1